MVSSAVRSSSGPVRGDLEPGGLHLVPVPDRHAPHPASRPDGAPARPGLALGWPGALPPRARASPHRPRRGRRRLAPAAHGGLADPRRPLLRRPRAVAPGPRGPRLLGRRPDAAHHRSDRAGRRRARHLHPGGAPPDARRGLRLRPAGARGRPRVARRRAGAGRGHPRAPGRPGDRDHRPQHQPARRTHAQPARAQLPPDRRRPDPDDRRRPLPAAAASAATTPTHRGWATGSSASTRPAGSSTPAPTGCRPTAGSASRATWPGWCSPT